MDFIYGILLIIIIIFILINFASVNISNTQVNNQDSQNQTQNQNQNQNFLVTNNGINSLSSSIPSPILSGAPLALNKKLNLEEQTYDYKKYFFV